MSTLKEIKENKSRVVSKILKADSSPDINLITELKEKTLHKDSKLRLTLKDYDLMCSNLTVFNMMCRILNCDKRKLKKICKYLNIIKENIELSPLTIKNKIQTYEKTVNTPILNLPKELRSKIVEKFESFLPKKYVLLDWIPFDKIDWHYLSANPNAIDLLEEKEKVNKHLINLSILCENPNALNIIKRNLLKIDWEKLSSNPNAVDFLEKHYKKIKWPQLSSNPNAIHLLEKNPKKIDYDLLSLNPNAIHLLEKNPTEINWRFLSLNQNAIHLLEKYPDRIHWSYLSENKNAIDLLKKYPNKIDWSALSGNPSAIDLLKENQDKIDWSVLSGNPNAIDFLKENQDKIDWNFIYRNPSIFKIEY